ncbi:MAG TPA: RDD family protein [Methylocystis sp.]|nr:RDD family protein [Methylocystis sp.]
MSDEASDSRGAASAEPALARQYFYDDGGGAIGPILGGKLKELIENGVVARHAHLNLVGAPGWVPILSVEPFASCFPPAPAHAHAAPQYAFASFWVRLGAYAIDQGFCLAATFVMAYLLLAVAAAVWGFEASRDYVLDHSFVANAVGLLTVLAYQAHFLAGPWQATPGKRILGIYVIRADGGRIDSAIAVLRYLCFMISAPVGFLTMFWTSERKALHDIVCGTRVVYGRREGALQGKSVN